MEVSNKTEKFNSFVDSHVATDTNFLRRFNQFALFAANVAASMRKLERFSKIVM